MPANTIPTIDVSPLFDDDYDAGLQQVAAELKKVYTSIGFGLIKGHQVSEELIELSFELAKTYFHLPLAEKLKCDIGELKSRSIRGLSGFVSSDNKVNFVTSLGVSSIDNMYESYRWDCQTQHSISDLDENAFDHNNQWPELLKKHAAAIKLLVKQKLTLLEKLVQAFAVAFGQDKNYLDALFKNTNLGFKLHYFAKHAHQFNDDQWNIMPHTDHTFLSLLAIDQTPGLQVLTNEDQWMNVPYKKGTLVLNTGEIVARLSNDHFVATKHRVATPPNCERFSIPMFLSPPSDAMIKPLDNFVKDGEKPHYEAEKIADIVASYSRS